MKNEVKVTFFRTKRELLICHHFVLVFKHRCESADTKMAAIVRSEATSENLQ